MINEKRLLDTFIGYAMIDSETKNEKAMELNIPILSEEDFLDLIGR